MKRTLWVGLLSVLLAVAGCTYDDSGLQKKVSDLDTRVSKNELDIKDLQSKINGDVKTYKDLVDALLNADYVKGVTSVVGEDGITVYTISFSQSGDVVIRAKGDKGETGDAGTDGETPYIGDNGNWWIGDTDTKVPATGPQGDTGATGPQGDTPRIGDNGNWWVGATDTGVPATGPAGKDGTDGTDGDDGVTPEVTIELGDDGVYYWKVNGQILKDGDGNPLRVTAVTPVFKIDDTSWWVSYDGKATDDPTKTWERVGLVADTGATVVEVDADSSDEYVILTINGKAVNIPKEKAFALVIKFEGDLGSVGVQANSTLGLAYEITGVKDTETTTVDVLSTTAGISAKATATDNKSGFILITTTDVTSGKIFVYADNNAGKTNIKSITLEEGVLTAIVDAQQVPAAGGVIPVSVETNMEYDVVIPDGIDWVRAILPTKATHIDEVKIEVDPNTTTAYRYTTVSIINAATAEVVKAFDVIQQPLTDAATDLASVAALPDDTPVVLTGVTTVAVSNSSAIVTDGTNVIYVKADGLAKDVVYTIAGAKTTDVYGATVIESKTAEAVEGATPAAIVPTDLYVYYGYGQNGFYDFYTGVNGVVQKDGDIYKVTTPKTGVVDQFGGPYTQIFVLDDPLATFGLDALVGKYVALSGWCHAVNTAEGAEDLITIPAAIREITFAAYDGWVPSYDGIDEEGYELITNTVANPVEGDYYTMGVYKKSALDAVDAEGNKVYASLDDFIREKALTASDDMLFNFTYYGMRGYPRDMIFSEFAHDATASDQFNPLDYDQYFILAVGVDAEGLASGKYAIAEFEKKDPAIKAAYADFLGTWTWMGDDGHVEVWEISQNVENESYYVSGINGVTNAHATPVAQYLPEKGQFTISNQNLGEPWVYTQSGTDYNLQDKLVAVYKSGSGYNSNESYMADPLIFTGALLEGDIIDVRVESDDYGPLEGMSIIAAIVDSNKFLKYADDAVWFPAHLIKGLPPEDPLPVAKYEDFLGNWEVPMSTGSNSHWVVSEKDRGVSYTITGIENYTANPVGTPVSVEALYTENGTMTIACQQVNDTYQYASYTFTDYLCGLLGTSYYKSAGSIIAEAGVLEDGSLEIRAGTVPGSSSKYTSFRFFWTGDKTYYATTAATALPNVGTRPAPASEDFLYWVGTWNIAGTNYAISADINNETYVFDGFSGFTCPLNFDAESGNILFKFQKTGDSIQNTEGKTFTAYNSGITAENYVAMGDDNDVIATFKKVDDNNASIVPNKYTVTSSDGTTSERNVISFGILGYNSGWANFGFLIDITGGIDIARASASSGAPRKNVVAPKSRFEWTPVPAEMLKMRKCNLNCVTYKMSGSESRPAPAKVASNKRIASPGQVERVSKLAK